MKTDDKTDDRSELDKKRELLRELNRDLFKLFHKRKRLSSEIQRMKSSNALGFYRWDIEQEKKLVESLATELEELSPKEKMAFSLLIEDHAHSNDSASYPEWSKAEHLGADFDLAQQMNPLLINESQRRKLPMSSHFQEVFDMIEEAHEKI